MTAADGARKTLAGDEVRMVPKGHRRKMTIKQQLVNLKSLKIFLGISCEALDHFQANVT